MAKPLSPGVVSRLQVLAHEQSECRCGKLRVMIDFPINELLDEERCRQWLEVHFHPNGLRCPNCQSERRRNFRQLRHFQAYRCLDCTRYYTLLSGTIFEKSQQAPSTLVMLIRGIAKGESSSQMSRELNLSRKQVGTIRRVFVQKLTDWKVYHNS